jgi:hypothetical protein
MNDLNTLTDAQLREVMRRDKNRAQAALDVWLARRGHTAQSASALICAKITAGLAAAVKKSHERLTRKYGRLN